MLRLHASSALLPEGMRPDVRITLQAGAIAAVEPAVPAEPGDLRCGPLLPGLPNLHSHAFQRGMAGLAETRGPGPDSFWSWRETMYRFALAMTPEDVEAVATQLFAEMLQAGFTRVGEFHYLHHDRDGSPYADPAEMAARICAAAEATGIRLTLLPVLYRHGGFGSQPAHAGQRRFVNRPDGFARLLESARAHAARLPGSVVGIAPHSLRAVDADDLLTALPLASGGPIHIHVAEQTREVEECVAWCGRRPVERLLDTAPVGPDWCLIHATHMTPAETLAVAAAGAVAGLCPVTEANLGDGIFDGPRFLDAGGRLGVGSDSNILIGAADELRQLEYSQRLRDRGRNVLAVAGGSTGRRLVALALAGGAQALGAPAPVLAPGAPADLVELDAAHPALAGRTGDATLDAFVFAGAGVRSVWVGGRMTVTEGRHVQADAILHRFRPVMARLAGTA
jgi:formiminoglutamate deiminase